MGIPIGTKKRHWSNALSTTLYLRKTRELIENDVLEAVKITSDPPSSAAVAFIDLIDRFRRFIPGDGRPTHDTQGAYGVNAGKRRVSDHGGIVERKVFAAEV